MDTWYYSREDLADKCLKVLEIGISPNLSVVAPRRKGKTLFMLHDLASLAVKRGYVPVYISLSGMFSLSFARGLGRYKQKNRNKKNIKN